MFNFLDPDERDICLMMRISSDFLCSGSVGLLCFHTMHLLPEYGVRLVVSIKLGV